MSANKRKHPSSAVSGQRSGCNTRKLAKNIQLPLRKAQELDVVSANKRKHPSSAVSSQRSGYNTRKLAKNIQRPRQKGLMLDLLPAIPEDYPYDRMKKSLIEKERMKKSLIVNYAYL